MTICWQLYPKLFSREQPQYHQLMITTIMYWTIGITLINRYISWIYVDEQVSSWWKISAYESSIFFIYLDTIPRLLLIICQIPVFLFWFFNFILWCKITLKIKYAAYIYHGYTRLNNPGVNVECVDLSFVYFVSILFFIIIYCIVSSVANSCRKKTIPPQTQPDLQSVFCHYQMVILPSQKGCVASKADCHQFWEKKNLQSENISKILLLLCKEPQTG